MKRIIFSIIIIYSSLAFFQSCTYYNEEELYPENPNPCDTTNVTYSQSINPVTILHCNVCHSSSLATGGIITDNYNDLKQLATSGLLWNAVNWTDGINNMPPDGNKLNDCDLTRIKIWIDAGAPDN